MISNQARPSFSAAQADIPGICGTLLLLPEGGWGLLRTDTNEKERKRQRESRENGGI